MNIPNGAQAVIDARKKGFKPAELLVVSLIGRVDELNHTIHANPTASYDWRWVVGLKACIFTRAGIDWKATAKSISLAHPDWLAVYDVDQFIGGEVSFLPLVDDIEKPKSQWRYRLHFLPWLPCQNKEFAWN